MGKITVILCTLDVILMALSMMLYLDEDRMAPVLHMEEAEMEYRDGMSEEGDVTGSLVVEKVSEARNGMVIVTFGAKDGRNNVAG